MAEWFTDLNDMANGKKPKIPLFCNSDWLELTDRGKQAPIDLLHLH